MQKIPREWDKKLIQFEFEYNASKHSSTGPSPFEVYIGRIPLISFTRSHSKCQLKFQHYFNVSGKQSAFTTIARNNLSIARARHKYYAEKIGGT